MSAAALIRAAAALAGRHRVSGVADLDAMAQFERRWWMGSARVSVTAALDAGDMSRVLSQHQRKVGAHGLTRWCTCGVDLGAGELTDHQAEVLRTHILTGES